MADHKVSDKDLDVLNQLINVAGVTTSAISGTQAEVEKNAKPWPMTQNNRDLVLWHNGEGVKHNIKQDEIQQGMQKWHDAVKKNAPVDPTVPPPVEVTPPPTGGDGGGTGPGNSTTPSGDVNVTLHWGVYQDRNTTGDPFIMSSIIGKLDVPSDPAEVAKVTNSRFSASEFEGSPCQKHLTVSLNPKDYGPVDGVNVIAEGGGTTPAIGVPTSAFQPGKTYYVNVRNITGSGSNPQEPQPGNYPSLMGYAPST